MADPIRKSDYEALAEFRRALRRFLHFSERAARDEGLTPQQHQVLLLVKGQVGRDWASISDLADGLQVRHNAAVALAARCEAAGLVTRTGNDHDRRVVRVSLTDHGETILARLSRRHLDELASLRGALEISRLVDTS